MDRQPDIGVLLPLHQHTHDQYALNSDMQTFTHINEYTHNVNNMAHGRMVQLVL